MFADFNKLDPDWKVNSGDWLPDEWTPCQTCKGTGEISVGRPGDIIRHDYCPAKCVGGMVEVYNLRLTIETLKKMMNQIGEAARIQFINYATPSFAVNFQPMTIQPSLVFPKEGPKP